VSFQRLRLLCCTAATTGPRADNGESDVKRTRKIAGIAAALALAGGITIGTTGTARADAIPGQPWTEVVPAFTNNTAACLDDPSGSATPGTLVQLWHCHGYGSDGGPQRWIFVSWGTSSPGNALYSIRSHNLCYGPVNTTVFSPGTRMWLATCNFIGGPIWTLHSRNAYSGDPVFTLEDAGWCMALPDFSGGNGEPVIIEPCNPGDELQDWVFG
jgi:hypothetical protein